MTLFTCILAGARTRAHALLSAAVLAAGLTGCESHDLSLAPEIEADAIAITTPEEAPELGTGDSAVLHFVNAPDTTFAVLDEDVGLDRRAAERIVRHRDGADRMAGTEDDLLFATLDELMAVPYVGPSALGAIDDFLLELAEDGAVVEGVAFTEEEEVLALALANTATLDELDLDLDLDRRAAEGIVKGRPFVELDAVAEVDFVGPASLERLRAATADMGGQ
jgi:DNA uptake protein ComE-like DNA-binding protein